MGLKDIFKFIKKDISDLKEKGKTDIWSIEDKSDFVYILNDKLIDHSSEIETFTEIEKVFYLCNNFDNEVQSCGGFYSVYTSDLGEYAYELPESFEKIGALEIAQVLKKLNELFSEKLPKDQGEREEYIDSVMEEIEEKMDEYFDEYSEYSNDLYLLLYDYAIKNKAEFKIIDN